MRGTSNTSSQTAGGDPRREAVKERMAVIEAEGAVQASADILLKRDWTVTNHGERLGFHRLFENRHTEAEGRKTMSAAQHRRGPAQGRINAVVGTETCDFHGIGRLFGARGSQMSGERTTAA